MRVNSLKKNAGWGLLKLESLSYTSSYTAWTQLKAEKQGKVRSFLARLPILFLVKYVIIKKASEQDQAEFCSVKK